MPLRLRAHLPIVAGAALWVAALAVGFGLFWRYAATAGRPADARPEWPASSALSRPADRAVVLHFVHPRCPCSRASLGELEALLERLPDKPLLHVVFMRPGSVATGWEQTDLWAKAQRIPGARLSTDVGGAEAQRFGAHTSGQTLAYDRRGALLFAGGITIGRGEAGENDGRRRLAATLASAAREARSSPVFGCPLEDQG